MSEYRKPDPPSDDYKVLHSDEIPGNILPDGAMYFQGTLAWRKSILIGEKPAPESWYAIPRPWREMRGDEIVQNGDEWTLSWSTAWKPVPAKFIGKPTNSSAIVIFRTRRPVEDARTQEVDQVEKEKDNAIVPGDVVRLKSGGPDMTVVAVDDDRVKCVWFHRESGSWSYQPSRAAFGSFVIEKVSV